MFTTDYDGPVILMLRSYAFSGRRRLVLVALLTSFLSLVGYVVWVVSNQLDCPSRTPLSFWIFIEYRSKSSDSVVPHQ